MTYIRDKKTNVVINSDISQYKTILAMRKKNKENTSLRTEVIQLKDQYRQLKDQVERIMKVLDING